MNNNNSNSNKNTHHQQQHHHHYGNEYSLFVGDLPDDCSDDELQRLFQSKFKSVKRVQIIRHEDGKSRGFGFIRFEDRHDFQAALSQEMRIGNKLLRLDTAHRSFKNRSRYPSINSSGSNSSHQQNHHPYNNTNSNNSNNNNSSSNNNNNSSSSSNNGSGSGLHRHHHHHHHNQSHHHLQHHHNQPPQQHLNSAHQQQQPQSQQGQTTKTLTQDQLIGNQQSHHSGPTDGPHRVNNSLHRAGANATNPATSTVHHPHAHHHQQHNSSHNVHLNHDLFNLSQQKNSQRQQTAGNRSPKQQSQPSLTSGDEDAVSQSQPKQSIASPQARPNLLPQQHQQSAPTQPIAQVGNSSVGLTVASSANITTTSTTAVTSLSSSDASGQSSSALVTNQPNINATGHTPIGHDFRGYPQSAMLDNPHLLGATDPASVVPPSSVYGHIYPYGPPPHFGYMPQPQPNPVIPISAGPPLPPNQGSTSTVVGPQHSLSSANTTRYGNAPHHQHHHPQAHLAGVPDASAMNTMTAGVQAPHQAPFYYYYPNPFYFDQSGAGAPPNMYHPQTLHPQFFALPNPAFMPNAHAYTNQQQTQPPTAPQSEANTTLVNQSQPPQPPQSHQQQVNIRTRDIDAPIE